MHIGFLRRIRVPHVFALLTGVILFVSVLTYVIPSGEYQREQKTYGTLTRTVVIPRTFESLPKHRTLQGVAFGDAQEGEASPTSLLGFLSAIPRGMEGAADIIFFIFIIGGVFGILQRTGTISAVLQSLLNRFSESGALLTIIMMTVLAIGGSTLGMAEEFIPLVPLFLMVSKRLGYDRIYGLALVVVAAEVGFSAATTNPFTLQIAQGIAEVPLGSGIAFRLVFFACALDVTLTYVLRYGARVKNDLSRSIMKDDDFSLSSEDVVMEEFTTARKMIPPLVGTHLRRDSLHGPDAGMVAGRNGRRLYADRDCSRNHREATRK